MSKLVAATLAATALMSYGSSFSAPTAPADKPRMHKINPQGLIIPAFGAGRGSGLTLEKGNYECDVKLTTNNDKTKVKCVGIPVIVLFITGSTDCYSFIPYAALKIKTSAIADKNVIKWDLNAPDGFVFDPTNGIRMEKIDPSAPGPMPADIWPTRQASADGRTFKISRPGQPPNASFKHDALVINTNVMPNKACLPLDPIISNDI